jgi:adenylate kinase family enzyme
MALRAKPAEIRPVKRAKILISGEPGSGKTYFSLQWPNVYFIDTEFGAEREQYQRKLIESKGVYLGRDDGVNTFEEVIKEMKALATEKHDYKTIVIDSISHLYNSAAAVAEEKGGSEFGRDKKQANIPSRQLLRWIDIVPMNVVLIAHQKVDWSNKEQVKTTYDFYDKAGYLIDIWLEMKGKNFVVRKSRIESFQENLVFSREYSKFAELFGSDIINKDVEPIILATEAQVERINQLVSALNVSVEEVEKLQKKFDVDEWAELTNEQITKGIVYFEAKLNAITPAASAPAKKGK